MSSQILSSTFVLIEKNSPVVRIILQNYFWGERVAPEKETQKRNTNKTLLLSWLCRQSRQQRGSQQILPFPSAREGVPARRGNSRTLHSICTERQVADVVARRSPLLSSFTSSGKALGVDVEVLLEHPPTAAKPRKLISHRRLVVLRDGRRRRCEAGGS